MIIRNSKVKDTKAVNWPEPKYNLPLTKDLIYKIKQENIIFYLEVAVNHKL